MGWLGSSSSLLEVLEASELETGLHPLSLIFFSPADTGCVDRRICGGSGRAVCHGAGNGRRVGRDITGASSLKSGEGLEGLQAASCLSLTVSLPIRLFILSCGWTGPSQSYLLFL